MVFLGGKEPTLQQRPRREGWGPSGHLKLCWGRQPKALLHIRTSPSCRYLTLLVRRQNLSGTHRWQERPLGWGLGSEEVGGPACMQI